MTRRREDVAENQMVGSNGDVFSGENHRRSYIMERGCSIGRRYFMARRFSVVGT